jgi:predicted DNA-binding transcriptional regulator AlpA
MTVFVTDKEDSAERNVLPTGTMPRGLSRVQAAEYVGVSPATFDRMIKDKLMPLPIRIYGRVVWDVRKLDEAFAALDKSEPVDNPWRKISV